MDFNTLMSESPKVVTVMNAIRNDPNLLNELKTNPEETLNKIGVELNEEELALVKKIGGLSNIEAEATGLFEKIKELFGFKEDSK